MCRILLLAFAILFRTLPAAAQELPAQSNIRADEDWSVLKTATSKTLPDWTRAKYVPLTSDGAIWLSTGLEVRARYEHYENSAWSDASKADDGYLWVRVMPHADLHVGRLRGFVQGIAGYAVGLANPASPTDRTGIDLLQGFGELALADERVRFRAGRELIALGSERLVGLRYGPNIPQPFDGLHATITMGETQVQFIHLRPVDIGSRDFDDHASDTKRLDGIYVTRRIGQVGLDAYWLGYRNRGARFDQGSGDEHRDTYGARAFGRGEHLGWNWEVMLQRGRFGAEPISAWSLGTDTSYQIRRLTVRVRADVISGDGDRSDGRLGSFNPMFPKGKYFGELTPIAPTNIIDLHPGLDFALSDAATIGFSEIAFWRHSLDDGIYAFGGTPVRSGRASRARFVGLQHEVVLNWHPYALVNVLASYSVFEPGDFIRESGSAQPIHMGALELMIRL